MKRVACALAPTIVAVLALGLVSSATADTFAGKRISARGVGPVRFGMDPEQASIALGAPLRIEPGINGCGWWTTPGARYRLQLLSLDGSRRLTLAFAYGSMRTTHGVKVGDTAKKLRRRYRHQLHRGTAPNYLGTADAFLFADRPRRGRTYTIMFAIDHGAVVGISAGVKRLVRGFGECA